MIEISTDLRRRLTVELQPPEWDGASVVVDAKGDTTSILVSMEYHQELQDVGRVSLVSDNMELVHVMNIAKVRKSTLADD